MNRTKHSSSFYLPHTLLKLVRTIELGYLSLVKKRNQLPPTNAIPATTLSQTERRRDHALIHHGEIVFAPLDSEREVRVSGKACCHLNIDACLLSPISLRLNLLSSDSRPWGFQCFLIEFFVANGQALYREFIDNPLTASRSHFRFFF
jgi:hypothetical protein